MTDLYFKGNRIDFQTKDIVLNDEKIALTVWLMPYSNGEEITISDFEYTYIDMLIFDYEIIYG